MFGPYRVPGPVEPNRPARCTEDGGPARCPSPRADPSVLPRRYTKALSAAATAFLLAATASISAVTYSIVRHQATPGPRSTSTAQDQAGREAADEAWRNAWQLATAGADVTLTRAVLPRAVVEAGNVMGAVRVQPETSPAGLRVVEIGDRSAAALAGVRAGDVITAVNGVRLSLPADGVRAFASARQARAVVADLWREGKRVVLRVEWQG